MEASEVKIEFMIRQCAIMQLWPLWEGAYSKSLVISYVNEKSDRSMFNKAP